MDVDAPMQTVEEYKAFCSEVLPELLDAGWTIDEDGPQVPNPISHSLPPVRLKLKDPDEGLHYTVRDAVRVANGVRPKREGMPKLTERQKNAMLRHMLDPGCAKGFLEGLDGNELALFPDFDDRWSGYRRALENFIQQEHEKVGR